MWWIIENLLKKGRFAVLYTTFVVADWGAFAYLTLLFRSSGPAEYNSQWWGLLYFIVLSIALLGLVPFILIGFASIIADAKRS